MSQCEVCQKTAKEVQPYDIDGMVKYLCRDCSLTFDILCNSFFTWDRTIFSVSYEYEDQLGVDITTEMFMASKVDGVRMYPYIEIVGQRFFVGKNTENELILCHRE